jgi:hypothetical protein
VTLGRPRLDARDGPSQRALCLCGGCAVASVGCAVRCVVEQLTNSGSTPPPPPVACLAPVILQASRAQSETTFLDDALLSKVVVRVDWCKH